MDAFLPRKFRVSFFEIRLVARVVCFTLFWVLLLSFSCSSATDYYTRKVQLVSTAYNVVMFVSWPEYFFLTPDAPFVFCSAGASVTGEIVEHYIEGRTVAGRSAQYRNIEAIEQIGICQVLILGSEQHGFIQSAMRIQKPGVLTICDSEMFARNGGMVGIVNGSKQSLLYVNYGALRKAQLKIGPELLSIVTIVGQ